MTVISGNGKSSLHKQNVSVCFFSEQKCTKKVFHNSNLLYEFYKTPFCRTCFLEHEERSEECYKANKWIKWLIKRV
jgi:hypothetical protein